MTRLRLAAAICALTTALLAGCLGPRSDRELSTPRSHGEWTGLVAEVRDFMRRAGFQSTRNFERFSEETQAFPFCGLVSRLYLPYSYEDPAIKWHHAATEEECRAQGRDVDVTFGKTEAIGERESPVTSSMLVAPLNRFLYLVIHEDCHDQFELPFGIEEALCNVIAFKAMAAFGAKRFRALSTERRAVERFVREGSRDSRATIASYERLAQLYERHDRAELPTPLLLEERSRIFRTAEKELSWPRGSMNNVWIANAMTYSRHYPLIERVFDTLGGDLERTMSFFRRVDALKPKPAEVMAKHRLTTEASVVFVRAFEAGIVETIERELANASVRPKGV